MGIPTKILWDSILRRRRQIRCSAFSVR